jgi:hypothetical protein
LSRTYVAATEDAGTALTSVVGEVEEIGRSETLNAEDGKSEEANVKNAKLIEKEKLKIVKEFHERSIGGHVGMNRIYKRLKQYVIWEGMKEDVENSFTNCEKCQKNNLTQCQTRMPLTITDTL